MKTALIRVGVCIFLCTLLNLAVNASHARNVMRTTGERAPPIPTGANNGMCGENVRWSLSGGTLRISGEGKMTDYTSDVDVPWYSKVESVFRVEIEDGVTSVGDYAFYAFEKVIDARIASTVSTIGKYAFYRCVLLTNVDIPTGLSSIGDYAFCQCSGLSGITIPSTVISIGDFAFAACLGFTRISIPESVSSFGKGALGFCTSLLSIDVDEGNRNYISIDGVLFDHERTALVQYPGAMPATAYTIPDDVVSIESFAFGGCSTIEFVTPSRGLSSIGEYAFYNCFVLKTIAIPANVASIGPSAFSYCPRLTSIDVENENRFFSSVDGVLFNNESTALLQYPTGKSSIEYVIPSGVVSIADNAFGDCDMLQKVVFPDSLTTIGHEAFAYCSNLLNVTLGNNVKSLGDRSFYYCSKIKDLTIGSNVESIGEYAFNSCRDLKKVTIPKSLKSLGRNAFESCTGLTSFDVEEGNEYFESVDGVLFGHGKTSLIQYPAKKTGRTYVIPDNTKTIESGAFRWNQNLVSVTISDNVRSVGDYAFEYCRQLNNLTFGNNVTLIGVYAFSGCSALENVTLPSSLTTIGAFAFYDCSDLHSLNISNVTSIGDSAFSECTSLERIDIPESVKYIGNHAFYFCKKLSSITLPQSLVSIGDKPFLFCKALTAIDVKNGNEHFKSINGVLFDYELTTILCYPGGIIDPSYTIPDTVTSIGDYSFATCSSLVEIVIPNSVISIGSHGFYYCSSLTNVSIPDSVKSIGHNAFAVCLDLELKLGENVEFIGHGAFSESGLTSLSIPKKVKSIGNFAFEQCAYLTSINVEQGNEFYSSIDGVLFDHEKTVLIQFPMSKCDQIYSIPDGVTTIEDHAFNRCGSAKIVRDLEAVRTTCHLYHVIIPDSVTIIGKQAFSCTDLENVTIGNNVKEIRERAFYSCMSLHEVFIPESVETMADSVFGYCSALTSVYYLGSQIMSDDVFFGCSSLETMCVAPNYNSSLFCGIDLNETSDGCQSFQSMFNYCYKPKYVNGEFIDEMRDNATEWIKKTNGCVEYHCDNETGGVRWSSCNNSNIDDITHICVDNTCVAADKIEENSRWIVELDMEDVIAIDMNISEVAMMIKELTGIGIDEVSVGYEIDNDGYVIRIVVYAEDWDEAKQISEAINGISKGAGCSYGTLCRTKSIRVKGSNWMIVSSGNQIILDMLILVLIIKVSLQ